MLFDWLVTGQVLPVNPAASVRGPKHVVKRGKTPVLSRKVKTLCAVKVGDSQWVQFPSGDGSLQPVAIGAAEEVTNPSKPLM